tara:strand:+ start:197 stop:985 length:789 start_codon:yes stop_codon:yes gene_type:complete
LKITDYYNKSTLNGKKIIVAGGSSGIGAALAKAASQLGASIILVGRDKSKLNKTSEFLNTDMNQQHLYYSVDLSSFDNSNELFNNLRDENKSIDGIVWSAGKELIKSSRLLSEEDVMETFGASNFGFLGALKSFSSKRFWSENGGSIIITSSIASKMSMPGMAVYGASKSSFSGMLNPLAKELSDYNTRINLLLMGAIKTDMHRRILSNTSKKAVENYENRHLFGFGETSDVIPMLIFLLSDLSKWITGTQITVDGGYYANS